MGTLSKEAKRRIQAVLDGRAGLATLQSSVELHHCAWHWNWDDDKMMLKLARHPLCDLGTALLIYWYASPRPFHQYANRDEALAQSPYDVSTYDLVMEIERRVLADEYSLKNIAFDPTNDLGTNWTLEYADIEVSQPIPRELMQPSPGIPEKQQDLYDIALQSLSNEESRKLDQLIDYALAKVGMSRTEADNNPLAAIIKLEQFASKCKKDPETAIDLKYKHKRHSRLSKALSHLWGHLVCKAYGWHWVRRDWGDRFDYAISPPNEELLIYPLTVTWFALDSTFEGDSFRQAKVISELFKDLEDPVLHKLGPKYSWGGFITV